MADRTEILVVQVLVPAGRLSMHIMAAQACHRRLRPKDHLPDIVHHVTIPGIHPCNRAGIEINSQVTKKVIAGNEIIRKGQARTARLSMTYVALATDRGNHAGCIRPFLREMHEARILCMFQFDGAVTGKTVNGDGREGLLF